jgi:hypothetical protein
MSTSRRDRTTLEAGVESLLVGADRLGTRLVPSVRFASFWTAVLVPFVLLALLVIGAVNPIVWSGLVAANVAGLVLGRNYSR